MYNGILFLTLNDFALTWNISYFKEEGVQQIIQMSPTQVEQYIIENKNEIKLVKIYAAAVPSTVRQATKMLNKIGVKYEVLN